MALSTLRNHPAWATPAKHCEKMTEVHLRQLFADDASRGERLAVEGAGIYLDYAWYLFVHHCAHHGPDKLPLPLLKHHQSHHRVATRNYGVSTTLWDHVFGTMLR